MASDNPIVIPLNFVYVYETCPRNQQRAVITYYKHKRYHNLILQYRYIVLCLTNSKCFRSISKNHSMLELGMTFEFYAIVAKGLNLKSRNILELIPTFVKVTKKKASRGSLFAPILNRIKHFNSLVLT